MTPGNEQSVGVQDLTAGRKVRTLEVETLIDGVPTKVEMQVLALADSAGNVIDCFNDYKAQQQIIRELQRMREVLERWLGASTFDATGHQESPLPS